MVGSLSTRVFDTRTATGSELFSLLTCLHTTTFISLSVFSLLETLILKIWKRLLSWRAKYSLPLQCYSAGVDPGEVKWVDFPPPPLLFLSPPSFFFFLSLKHLNQALVLLHYYKNSPPPPNFKIVDPRLQW